MAPDVKLVLRGIEALNRRDVDGALRPFHANLRFLDAGTDVASVGRDAMGEWLRDFLESWASYSEVCEEVVELGDRVMLVMRTEGRGHRSKVTVTDRHAEVHEFRDGLVVALTVYPTPDDAREALGLKAASPPGAPLK